MQKNYFVKPKKKEKLEPDEQSTKNITVQVCYI